MNIIQANLFLILLIAYQVNSSCPTGSKELDDQCSTYCYQVVKPLLQYVNTITTMTQEQNELQQTIKVQAETIKNLNDLIKSKDMQLEQQNKLSQLSESHARNQQKLIDQFQMQLSNLKLEIQPKVNINEFLKTFVSSCLHKMTGTHVITLPDARPFIVSCESNLIEAGTGWTVIQRRKDGSVDFNRTWLEYKEGFGDKNEEFFFGLENLNIVTQFQPHELYILLVDFGNETRYARYNNFVIGNETEFYKIEELGIYSGNAGDGMEFHKNIMFSTADKFNHTNNMCAKEFNSGWWFNSDGCYVSNLNGKYDFCDTDEDVAGVSWRHWKQLPLKFSQMMIRPITK